jgi:hypothetical protein
MNTADDVRKGGVSKEVVGAEVGRGEERHTGKRLIEFLDPLVLLDDLEDLLLLLLANLGAQPFLFVERGGKDE